MERVKFQLFYKFLGEKSFVYHGASRGAVMINFDDNVHENAFILKNGSK